MSRLRTINTADKDLELLQGNIQRALDQPSTHSVVTGIQLRAGQVTVVSHGLGQALKGWSLARKRGPGDVWDEQDGNKSPALTLYLTTDTDVIVDVEVYAL